MGTADFDSTLPRLLRHRVRDSGADPLIVHGNETLSYHDVERRSATLAKGLLVRGVGKGTRVALWIPNGPDWLIAWAAAARVGARVVPLNTFYRASEVGWALRHCDAQLLITVSNFLANDHLAILEEAIPDLAAHTGGPLYLPTHPTLREILVWGSSDRHWALSGPDALSRAAADAGAIDETFLEAIEEDVSPADPMVTIYSSGSVGDPKGAVHSHGALLRHAHTLNGFRDLVASDRLYSPMPFFWVGGLVFSLLSVMDVGACILTEDVFEPAATLDFLERERATIVAGWPHYAKAMADHPSFPDRDFSAVRGGNLYQMLPEALRPADPELRSNSLGMTETCGPHTIDRMDVDLPESLRGSFGHSVPGLEHKIVDPDSGAELSAGEVGEICVRGYSVMQGLYKREREAVFDADGYYHTGDVGFFDADGVLYFQSRLGELIKTGGANVTPREVEAVLEAIPEVREAYVLGRPDPDRGQVVEAVIVLQGGKPVGSEALRSATKKALSAYKVPRAFHFYEHAELPFTDSGKIDKRALLEKIEEASDSDGSLG